MKEDQIVRLRNFSSPHKVFI